RFVHRYPSLRGPLAGFLRSALTDEVVASIDERLRNERARLDLTALAGFLRSALTDEVVASIDERLRNERARLDLTDLDVELDLEYDATLIDDPETLEALATYWNRRDQLYLNALMNEQFQRIREYAPAVINMLYHATATTLIALLFSFLILVDLKRIKRGITQLKTSRIGDFYDEAAQPIVRFGVLVGRAIEAQAWIATLNTALTLLGLLLLGIPLVAMLSVIVFVCSFIPV